MAKLKLIVNKVFDICKQQDCLTPACKDGLENNYLISPSRNDMLLDIAFTTSTGEEIIIAPDEIVYVPYPYRYIGFIEKEDCQIEISANIENNPLFKGQYDLTATYKIKYNIEFFDENYNPISFTVKDAKDSLAYKLHVYSIYTKKVTLCGASKNTIVTNFNSTLDESQCYQYPEYNIQASTFILKSSLIPVTDLLCNHYVDQSKSSLDPKGVSVINVILGLFTTLLLYRKSLIEIDGNDEIEIPTCNDSNNNPCEDFYSLAFPFDYFFPSNSQ